MTGIEELRERVLQAERRFGVIDEQHAKYSGRLITLMNAIDGRLREQQSEIEQQSEEIVRQGKEMATLSTRLTRAAGENEQLRAMLHTLLKAIEGGQRDILTETMLSLDSTVCALMQGSAQEAELNQTPLEPVATAPWSPAEASGKSEVADPPDEDMPVAAPELMPDPTVEEAAEVAADEPLEFDDVPEPVDAMAVDEELGADNEDAGDIDHAPEAPLFVGPEDAAPAPITEDAGLAVESDEPGEAMDDMANAGEIVADDESAADFIAGDETGTDETAVEESAVEDIAEEPATPQPCTLDEIMRRVSRLVEEADAAGLPAGAEDAPSAGAEEAADDDSTPETDDAMDRAIAAS